MMDDFWMMNGRLRLGMYSFRASFIVSSLKKLDWCFRALRTPAAIHLFL